MRQYIGVAVHTLKPGVSHCQSDRLNYFLSIENLINKTMNKLEITTRHSIITIFMAMYNCTLVTR